MRKQIIIKGKEIKETDHAISIIYYFLLVNSFIYNRQPKVV